MKSVCYKNVFFVKESRETICKLPWGCEKIVESKLFPTIGGTFQLELYCRRQCKSCSELHYKKGSRERLSLDHLETEKVPQDVKPVAKTCPIDEKKLVDLWKKKEMTVAGIARELDIPGKQVLAIAKKLNLQPQRRKKILAK